MIWRFRESRWPKRLLLVGCMILVGLTLKGAMSSVPQLRPRDGKSLQPEWPVEIKETARSIDAEIADRIDESGLKVASPADWRILCRRISLALVGSSPSLEELRAIEQIPAEERIVWWTEYLLADSRWSHSLAERFSRAIVGTQQGPFLLFRRRKFELWLADQFFREVPYDQIVREMIGATGLWTDRPEVNFLTATIENGSRVDPVVLAGRTSRAFLGTRLDCLQCHDDLLGNIHLGSGDVPRGGTQRDFQGLAAYYGSTRVAKNNPLAGLRDDKRPYRVQLLGDSEPSEVKPKLPFLEELALPDVPPRQQLAAWVTHPENKAFARATVNRVWAIMFGLPLVQPIDNIPLHGPFPPGLELLSESFVANGYQMKRLVRTIVALEAFHRDSRLDGEAITEEHEAKWAVFPLTQLRPDQVAASLHQACRLQMIDHDSSILAQLELFGTLNDFTKEYGDRGEDEFIAQSVTLPQRLLMMNGKLVRERTEENPINNASAQIALLAGNDDQAIIAAYLATLSRLPTEHELDCFRQQLTGMHGRKRSQAMGDLFWSLLNSTEFLWNH